MPPFRAYRHRGSTQTRPKRVKKNYSPDLLYKHKLAYLATKASYGDKGSIQAMQNLGYLVDPELSTDNALTFYSNKNQTPIVAFRGTQNLSDIRADSTIVTGRYDDPAFADADTLYQRAKLKYAAQGIPIVTGHSLGGTKAARVGNQHGGDIIVFNPGTGPYNLKVKGHVYRTDRDIISQRVEADSEDIADGGHSLHYFEYLNI